jgi:hypothetical protein
LPDPISVPCCFPDKVPDIPTSKPLFAQKVDDVTTYQINDNKFLIKYTTDGSNITLLKTSPSTHP